MRTVNATIISSVKQKNSDVKTYDVSAVFKVDGQEYTIDDTLRNISKIGDTYSVKVYKDALGKYVPVQGMSIIVLLIVSAAILIIGAMVLIYGIWDNNKLKTLLNPSIV